MVRVNHIYRAETARLTTATRQLRVERQARKSESASDHAREQNVSPLSSEEQQQ